MTIALTIKVSDGAVMACDSAASQSVSGPQGQQGIGRIYFGANKMLNVHKGLPVGVQAFGAASIGARSLTLVLKDFRRELMKSPKSGGIDETGYTMAEIAQRLSTHIQQEWQKLLPAPAPGTFGTLGLYLVGYSAKDRHCEVWTLEFNGPALVQAPQLVYGKGAYGIVHGGVMEAIYRLHHGFSSNLPNILQSRLTAGNPQALSGLIASIRQGTVAEFVDPAMPIQDAIELAEFLVDVTIKFVRFSGGPPVVSGPIEIAAITQHEGFKWISRKHYYDSQYNIIEKGNTECLAETTETQTLNYSSKRSIGANRPRQRYSFRRRR